MDGFEKQLEGLTDRLLVMSSLWDDEKMQFEIKLQVSSFNSCWMVRKLPVIHTENPGEGANLGCNGHDCTSWYLSSNLLWTSDCPKCFIYVDSFNFLFFFFDSFNFLTTLKYIQF